MIRAAPGHVAAMEGKIRAGKFSSANFGYFTSIHVIAPEMNQELVTAIGGNAPCRPHRGGFEPA
jgi:hypothetical protein